MIRIEAKYLTIDCPRDARWQRGREILRAGEAMGKGNLGLVLALSHDMPLADAHLILSAGPDDADGAHAAFSWLSHIPTQGSAPCRTALN